MCDAVLEINRFLELDFDAELERLIIRAPMVLDIIMFIAVFIVYCIAIVTLCVLWQCVSMEYHIVNWGIFLQWKTCVGNICSVQIS